MMHNISGDMRNYKTYVAWSYQVNNTPVLLYFSYVSSLHLMSSEGCLSHNNWNRQVDNVQIESQEKCIF